jgi:hypothetical protein
MTSGRQLAISRWSIGLGALILLALGVGLTVWPQATDSRAWPDACLKTGIVLGVVWLAYPQVARIPTWFLLAGLAAMACVLLLARQPRVLILAVAVMLLVSRLKRPGGSAKGKR